MKFFYAIMILAQLAMAILFRNENKTAYLLYLWNNLSGHEVQAGRHHTKSMRASKINETKSHTGDNEYSFFLER